MVAQFTIRCYDLYRQLAEDVSTHHIPDTFLASLREPRRTTLTLTDFSNQTIEQVITSVLARVLHGLFTKHSSTTGGPPFPTRPPMHGLLGLGPSGPRVPSPATLSNMSVPS